MHRRGGKGRVTGLALLALAALVPSLAACGGGSANAGGVPTLRWYVFDEPSGAFAEAAADCTRAADGRYRIDLEVLPADADQQREQLVRRLAANDSSIDLMGMDVIWTAEFAEAGWILPWDRQDARRATEGRLEPTVESATYDDRLYAAPFTTNTQLLWYRKDRVDHAPETWDEMVDQATEIGDGGTIQAQGERYEGLTVMFISLLASAGGTVLNEDGTEVALPEGPTHRALEVMRDFARSSAADPALSTTREDQARLAFESGDSSFMVNYTFVYPSAQANVPDLAEQMGWARWPGVEPGEPSRVTLGGINIGVGADSRHPDLAFDAAACIADTHNQRPAAVEGGLLPTSEGLYDTPAIQRAFPFADLLRETLQDAVLRPQTPFYNDVSLAITRTLHPMRDIDPDADVAKLRAAIERALNSEGLL